MPLRQVARTPKTDYPPRPNGVPYAFAAEVRQMLDAYLSPFELVVVRCPWCGDEETVPAGFTPEGHCTATDRRFIVAIPAGTAVLA